MGKNDYDQLIVKDSASSCIQKASSLSPLFPSLFPPLSPPRVVVFFLIFVVEYITALDYLDHHLEPISMNEEQQALVSGPSSRKGQKG
jgi:hypothetical protein